VRSRAQCRSSLCMVVCLDDTEIHRYTRTWSDRSTGPGSFIESLKFLPLLSDAQRTSTNPAFHIVVPSLPNFGFSQGVSKRGFAIAQHAETCHKLMLQLGYMQYVTQGGDVGTTITRAIGSFFPESCKASHVNYIRGTPPAEYDATMLTEREKKALKRTAWFEKEGIG